MLALHTLSLGDRSLNFGANVWVNVGTQGAHGLPVTIEHLGGSVELLSHAA